MRVQNPPSDIGRLTGDFIDGKTSRRHRTASVDLRETKLKKDEIKNNNKGNRLRKLQIISLLPIPSLQCLTL